MQKPAGGPLPGGRWWWVAGAVFAVIAVLSASGHVPGTADQSPSAVNTGSAFHGDDILGTRGHDLLTGTAAGDILFAFGGNDRVYAGDGSDLIDAGQGEDLVSAGPGDDRIRAFDDTADVIYCGPGYDVAFVDPGDVTHDCEELYESDDMSSPSTPDPPQSDDRESGHAPAPTVRGTISVKDQPWECRGPVDVNLVKVTVSANAADQDAIVLAENCTGRIGRIEIDTWSGDGIKVQNSAPVAHDLVIESGYVQCHSKSGSYHQDGIQAMGGERITFRNLSVDCGGEGVNAALFIAKGGSEDSIPTDVVFENGVLGPDAAHTILLASAKRSGVRNTVICPGRIDTYRVLSSAAAPVDRRNVEPATSDPRC